VNASGNLSLGDHVISAGLPLAGQRVTLRLDGPVAHILSGGTLVRTVARPVPEPARTRLRGARAGTAAPPRLPEPQLVKRRVSVRGAIMIGGQRIQVGLPHAGKTAEVTIEADTYQITVDDSVAIPLPARPAATSNGTRPPITVPALRLLHSNGDAARSQGRRAGALEVLFRVLYRKLLAGFQHGQVADREPVVLDLLRHHHADAVDHGALLVRVTGSGRALA
jgi:hypothetical protein